MCKSIIESICFVAVVCVLSCQAWGQKADKVDIPVQEAPERLPLLWNKYLRALGSVEGTIRRDYKWTRGGQLENEFHEYNVAFLYPLTLNENAEKTSVIVFGNNYEFILNRQKMDDCWRIENLNQFSTKPDKKRESDWTFPSIKETEENDKSAMRICSQLCVGLELQKNFIYLPVLWDSDALKIEEFRKVETDPERALFLKFKFHQEPPHPFTWIAKSEDSIKIEGELYLVSDYFLIKRGTVLFQLGDERSTLEVNCEYDEVVYMVPLPKQYFSKTTYPDVIFEQNISFDLREIDRKNMRRFTLSAYGLPEPDFGERRTNRFRYTLMAIGSLMIIFALWQMYQKRKENKA